MRLMRIAKTFGIILIWAAIVGIAAYFVAIKNLVGIVENRLAPCSRPVTYSLGAFDNRFGISKQDFLSAVESAAQIWQVPVNKTLFTSDANGTLKINLIYDARQQMTQRLQKLGLVLNDDQATYNRLKAEYRSLRSTYDPQKQSYDALLTKYQAEEKAYSDAASYWNSRGGAARQEYNQLKQERENLNTEAGELRAMQTNLNELVGNINAVANALNHVAQTLNLNVATYNTIGAEQGATFEEGAYVSDASGPHIDIYQFNDRDKLIRVLAHELGHALGLGHLSNPQAIMYYLNEAGNEKLTADDLAALKTRCGI